MIKRVNPADIPGKGYKDCAIQRDIFEFHDSDWDVCEVEIGGYKTASSAYAAYKSTAKRLGVNVTAFTRNGRVFLAKEKD